MTTMTGPSTSTSSSTSHLLVAAAGAAACATLLTYTYCRRRFATGASSSGGSSGSIAGDYFGSSKTSSRNNIDDANVYQLQKDEFDLIPACRGRVDHTDPRPRTGYLSWDDYFMAVAFLSAQRSKDPNKQVGACIVSDDHVILGIGYNGFPRGCPDHKLPWAKKSSDGDLLDTKYPYVCHAEMNALLNKNAASAAGTRIYVTMFPCNECAKLLIQSGIKEVVFHEDKTSNPNNIATTDFSPSAAYEASRRLLSLSGVQLRQHKWERPLLLRLCNAL